MNIPYVMLFAAPAATTQVADAASSGDVDMLKIMLVVMVSIFVVLMPVAMVSALYLRLPKSKRERVKKQVFGRVFVGVNRIPVLSGNMKKVATKLSLLSIYNQEEIPIRAAQVFLTSFGITLGIILFAIFGTNDVVTASLVISFAFIVNGIMVDRQMDSTYVKVLKSTVRAFSVVEQIYMSTKNIPDSLSESDIPKLLKRPISDIYDALTGVNGEMKLEQFITQSPFRPLQTFAGVAYNLNMYGDTTDYQGVSGFVRALTLLRSDVNAEIERIALQNSRFAMLQYLPLIGIIGINPLESFLIGTIPGLAMVYKGLLGFIVRAVIMAVSIVGFIIISQINSPAGVSADDRGGWVIKLLTYPKWRRFMALITPKKDKTRVKLQRTFAVSLSKMRYEHLYTKKVVFSTGLFVLAIIIFFLSIALGKSYMRDTTDQLSLIGGTERTDEQKERMRQLDDQYFASNGTTDDPALDAAVRGFLPELSDMQVLEEMDRIKDKYESWANLYFHWYLIPVAWVVGVVGWFVPNLILFIRKLLVMSSAEDDYMQLQTLVSVLMYTDCDTLQVLDHLARQSTVHKQYLLWAYHSFVSAPEMELERLKAKIGLTAFKYFIEKLKLTISELSLKDAFSDLIAERDAMMRLRHIAMETTIKRKAVLCSIIAITPMVLFVIGEFAAPIMILGMRELDSSQGMF